MKPPKVVFDTNILISAIVYGGNPKVCLGLAREGKIKLITSKSILLELIEKLQTKIGMSQVGIKRTIISIKLISDIVDTQETVSIIKKDESDNRILEVAKASGADYIITGDKKHILPLKKYGKTHILTAAEFIKTVDFGD
jgi:putative PIN family toxin of toxin-antitoxin system